LPTSTDALAHVLSLAPQTQSPNKKPTCLLKEKPLRAAAGQPAGRCNCWYVAASPSLCTIVRGPSSCRRAPSLRCSRTLSRAPSTHTRLSGGARRRAAHCNLLRTGRRAAPSLAVPLCACFSPQSSHSAPGWWWVVPGASVSPGHPLTSQCPRACDALHSRHGSSSTAAWRSPWAPTSPSAVRAPAKCNPAAPNPVQEELRRRGHADDGRVVAAAAAAPADDTPRAGTPPNPNLPRQICPQKRVCALVHAGRGRC